MSKNVDYYLTIRRRSRLIAQAERIFDLVWRIDFTAPGFALLEIVPGVKPRVLRSWMVALKERLSEIAASCGRGSLRYGSMARMNQRESTGFHLDNAPDQSFVMLGYEPSKLRNRLFVADYSRAASELGVTPQRFLADLNEMSADREKTLAGCITELPQPRHGCSRILLVNNSCLPFSEARANTLGVLHRASVAPSDANEGRIITLMTMEVANEIDRYWAREFIALDKITHSAAYKRLAEQAFGRAGYEHDLEI